MMAHPVETPALFIYKYSRTDVFLSRKKNKLVFWLINLDYE